MPLGKNVGENIKELKQANKTKAPSEKRGLKQIIAIALSGAREKGAKIPYKK